ncbi:MAG: hypothetical protein F6K19_20990 [Cyanothece sp. SIO1E1]|nr:hypothetical protein [Cyanothece sp. SIO1E1]
MDVSLKPELESYLQEKTASGESANAVVNKALAHLRMVERWEQEWQQILEDKDLDVKHSPTENSNPSTISTQALIEKLMATGLYNNPVDVMSHALELLRQSLQRQEEWFEAELHKGMDQLERGEKIPLDWSRIEAKVAENIKNGVKVRKNSAALPPLID